MAATADAATDRASRSTAPSLASFTVCAFAKVNAVHAGNLFHPVMRVEAGGGTAAVFGFKGANGRSPSLYSASSSTGISGAEVPLGSYVFMLATMNGGPAQIFTGAPLSALTKVTGTVNTTGTPDTITLFSRSPSDGSEWLEGTLTGVRVWTSVLSDAEAAAEALSIEAVKTANLWGSWTLAGGSLLDTSGNGRHLTPGSTGLTADADPVLSTASPRNGAFLPFF